VVTSDFCVVVTFFCNELDDLLAHKDHKGNTDTENQQQERAVKMFQFQSGHSGALRLNDALLVASTVSAVPMAD